MRPHCILYKLEFSHIYKLCCLLEYKVLTYDLGMCHYNSNLCHIKLEINNFPPHLKWIQPPALPHMVYLAVSAGLRFDTRVEAWDSGLGQNGDVLYGCHVVIIKK